MLHVLLNYTWILGITRVYEGGLTAVIWTDFIQTILMLIGAIILAALGK